MSPSSLLDDAKKLSPGWWGAIAGAIAAGASLFPDSRLVGGLGAGVAMFLVAKKLTGSSCCAACADAPVQQQQAQAQTESREQLSPAMFFSKVTQPVTSESDCVGCGGLS